MKNFIIIIVLTLMILTIMFTKNTNENFQSKAIFLNSNTDSVKNLIGGNIKFELAGNNKYLNETEVKLDLSNGKWKIFNKRNQPEFELNDSNLFEPKSKWKEILTGNEVDIEFKTSEQQNIINNFFKGFDKCEENVRDKEWCELKVGEADCQGNILQQDHNAFLNNTKKGGRIIGDINKLPECLCKSGYIWKDPKNPKLGCIKLDDKKQKELLEKCKKTNNNVAFKLGCDSEILGDGWCNRTNELDGSSKVPTRYRELRGNADQKLFADGCNKMSKINGIEIGGGITNTEVQEEKENKNDIQYSISSIDCNDGLFFINTDEDSCKNLLSKDKLTLYDPNKNNINFDFKPIIQNYGNCRLYLCSNKNEKNYRIAGFNSCSDSFLNNIFKPGVTLYDNENNHLTFVKGEYNLNNDFMVFIKKRKFLREKITKIKLHSKHRVKD